jgi:hypothetical protein
LAVEHPIAISDKFLAADPVVIQGLRSRVPFAKPQQAKGDGTDPVLPNINLANWISHRDPYNQLVMHYKPVPPAEDPVA